jgi:glycosyltransferase involved in cell wall biosynthesis
MIALFLPTLGGGGAERNVLRLAAGLVRAGHDVTIVAATGAGPNSAWLPPGAEFVDLKAGRIAKAIVPLSRFLRRRRPAVLLSALDDANIAAVAARWLAGVQVPIVITVRIAQSASEAYARGVRPRWIIPWLVRRSYPHADAIVAVSSGAAADLADVLAIPRDRVIAIPNPVVTDRLEALRDEPVSHPWLRDIGPAPLIVAVGRLAIQKDYDLLVRAFARVREARPDARLAILGEGDERHAIDATIRELGLERSVLLAGFQDNPYAWMRRADVLALSSRFEGLPTVLIEGLACGARIVSTDCPTGPVEILDNGRWGRLVPVGDVAGFAHALIETLGEGRWPQPPEESLHRYREEPVVRAYERIICPLMARGAVVSTIAAAEAGARARDL